MAQHNKMRTGFISQRKSVKMPSISTQATAKESALLAETLWGGLNTTPPAETKAKRGKPRLGVMRLLMSLSQSTYGRVKK
jgi:hypothetical protein